MSILSSKLTTEKKRVIWGREGRRSLPRAGWRLQQVRQTQFLSSRSFRCSKVAGSPKNSGKSQSGRVNMAWGSDIRKLQNLDLQRSFVPLTLRPAWSSVFNSLPKFTQGNTHRIFSSEALLISGVGTHTLQPLCCFVWPGTKHWNLMGHHVPLY